MRIIAVANQKGGVGKTTTAVNLAACLGKMEQRVLLIDMDPQGHASLALGRRGQEQVGLYEVFAREATLAQVIQPQAATGVDLIPSTISLAAAEHLLGDWPRERELSVHLAQLGDAYDYAIIDCPPALGLLSFNALLAADEVLVPIEMGVFAFDGIERLCETIDLLEERYQTNIPLRVLPTMVDNRTRLSRKFLREIWERFPDEVLPLMVHQTVRLKEAACEGLPIIDYDPKSAAAADYQRLAREIMRHAEEHDLHRYDDALQLAPTMEHHSVARL